MLSAARGGEKAESGEGDAEECECAGLGRWKWMRAGEATLIGSAAWKRRAKLTSHLKS